MFCVGYDISPECIFYNQHKVLYNIFSPDPAGPCVADKQVSHQHHEINTLYSVLLHFIQDSVMFLAMDVVIWAKWTFSRMLLEFFKLILEAFH